MKKVLLSVAVVAASLMGFTSCLSSAINKLTEEQCWEVVSEVKLESETKTVTHYYWGTSASVAVQATADLKKEYGGEGNVSISHTSKDASKKYKTQEDCEAANK